MKQQSRLSLIEFLEGHGKSLQASGSAERGLSVPDALQFIEMLQSAGLAVLGVERWDLIDGQYELESLGGWIADETNNSWPEARDFLLRQRFPPTSVFAIQF